MASRILYKSKFVHASPIVRKIHVVPFLLGRKSRALYAAMDANQKQEFWKRNGKVALGIAGVTGGLVAAVYLTHLEKAPVTNRRRFMLLSLEDEVYIGRCMSQHIFDGLERDGKKLLPPTDQEYKRVEYVWARLLRALPNTDVDQSVAKSLLWNLNVIDSPEVRQGIIVGNFTIIC